MLQPGRSKFFLVWASVYFGSTHVAHEIQAKYVRIETSLGRSIGFKQIMCVPGDFPIQEWTHQMAAHA